MNHWNQIRNQGITPTFLHDFELCRQELIVVGPSLIINRPLNYPTFHAKD